MDPAELKGILVAMKSLRIVNLRSHLRCGVPLHMQDLWPRINNATFVAAIDAITAKVFFFPTLVFLVQIARVFSTIRGRDAILFPFLLPAPS